MEFLQSDTHFSCPDNPMPKPNPDAQLPLIPRILFMSRWLQLPLYVGLILAQGVYV